MQLSEIKTKTSTAEDQKVHLRHCLKPEINFAERERKREKNLCEKLEYYT